MPLERKQASGRIHRTSILEIKKLAFHVIHYLNQKSIKRLVSCLNTSIPCTACLTVFQFKICTCLLAFNYVVNNNNDNDNDNDFFLIKKFY